MSSVPQNLQDAVLVKSEKDEFIVDKNIVKGYDFNQGVNYDKLFESYLNTGFQATNFAKAVKEINNMLNWRPSEEDLKNDENCTPNTRCKIFLGYTSNLISSGLRETLKFLVQHKMVDCIVTTAGGIEEDFIKCFSNTYMGEFNLKGKELRLKGLNRIGNLLVPNDNYCKFEDWVMPILDQLLKEQIEDKVNWTPSKIIARLGKEINHEDSVYYWAYKNNIPVYSPAITDGSLGDMIYFHTFKNPGLVIDLVEDIRRMNNEAVFAKKTGIIILGGGVVKHHICNANLMRNGAEYAVFLNTASEYDGSDAGAKPEEAKSWGKIKVDADPVKIYGEATMIFPLLVAQTFAKQFEKQEN